MNAIEVAFQAAVQKVINNEFPAPELYFFPLLGQPRRQQTIPNFRGIGYAYHKNVEYRPTAA